MENKDALIPMQEPYNPLEKRNIGENIVRALLDKPKESLPPARFIGAGVYAIYYEGNVPSFYNRIRHDIPIYVGKAVPSGARKGNVGMGEDQGLALYNRLKQHADSISAVSNLQLRDFTCRYLAVDDIWIPLAETLLIEKFQPVWNVVVDGFGNHDPGKGRHRGKMPLWDCLHPGRAWAERLQPCAFTAEELEQRVREYLRDALL